MAQCFPRTFKLQIQHLHSLGLQAQLSIHLLVKGLLDERNLPSTAVARVRSAVVVLGDEGLGGLQRDISLGGPVWTPR